MKGTGRSLDWGIVRKESRQVGLIIIVLAIISQAFPFGISWGWASLAFTAGLVTWLFGLLEPRSEGAEGRQSTDE